MAKRTGSPPRNAVVLPGATHISAIEGIKQLENESVRLLLSDLPYNVARRNNFESMGRTSIDYPWDADLDHLEWLELMWPKIMPGGSIALMYDWKRIGEVMAVVESCLGGVVKRPIFWRKTNPFPGNARSLPAQVIEQGFWAIKPGNGTVFNCPEELSYCDFLWWDLGIPRAKEGRPRHEAKKPVELCRGLISILTNPDELVVDPYCGSGSTLVAAQLEGRSHYGFDIDKNWVKESNERILLAKKGILT